MAHFRTVSEYLERQSEIRARLQEITEQYSGERFDEDTQAEWNALNEEFDANEGTIQELRLREERMADLLESGSTESGVQLRGGRVTRTSDRDIFDLVAVRRESRSEEHMVEMLHDNAMRAVDRASFGSAVSREDAQEHIKKLLDNHDNAEGEIAKRILQTGSPLYRRAFTKALAGREVSAEERTALGIASGGIGGYAIPYTLDPTVIPTSNFSVNPYRSIARVIPLTGSNTWQGVSSAGVSASFDAEAQEVSDDSPTLVQPSATARMARAFVQFSMELDDDWGSLQSEMSALFQDAKDDLESSAFTTGSGTAPNPLGILETGNATGIGTAAFVATTGTAAFVIADVYKLETSLAPRWRPRATFVANRAVYNAIRQFDTAGGAGRLIDNLQIGLTNQVPTPGGLGMTMLGYPAREASAMASTPATTAALTLLFGDFNQFVIVDRIGMNVEVVPQMFATANNLPSGQRGLFARWRTGSTVAAPTAFKVLKVG